MQELSCGQSAYIRELALDGAIKARLLDLGFIAGSRVTCLFTSALGDPRAYEIRGTTIALRAEDAQRVLCRRGRTQDE